MQMKKKDVYVLVDGGLEVTYTDFEKCKKARINHLEEVEIPRKINDFLERMKYMKTEESMKVLRNDMTDFLQYCYGVRHVSKDDFQ